MNFGKIPSIPVPPSIPSVPAAPTNHVEGSLAEGPLAGSVGVAAPRNFNPNNPQVQVSGTIHNPTGVGGDLHIQRTVAIPTSIPDVHLPSLGNGNADPIGGGGGFGLPHLENPLSGLSVPDIGNPFAGLSAPELGNPFSGLSVPELSMPSFGGLPDLPSLPSIGTPGMPGFRFTDLPEFSLLDLDLSGWDLSMPDLLPDFGGDSDSDRSTPNRHIKSAAALPVDLVLNLEGRDAIQSVPFKISNDDDWSQAATFDDQGKNHQEVPRGRYQVEILDPESVRIQGLARLVASSIKSKDSAQIAAILTRCAPSLAKIEKIWSSVSDASAAASIRMDVVAAMSGSPLGEFAALAMASAGMGLPNFFPYGLVPPPARLPPQYAIVADQPELIFQSGQALRLQAIPLKSNGSNSASSSGKWSAMIVPRSDPGSAKFVDGPTGSEWKDFPLDTAGWVRILWKTPSPTEGYVLDFRVADKMQPGLMGPITPGTLDNPSWALGAMIRFRDLVHHLSKEFPVQESVRQREKAEWDRITEVCQNLNGTLADATEPVPDSDKASMASWIGPLQEGLLEESLDPTAWARLFSTSEPPRLKLSSEAWRWNPDAFLVAWHLFALHSSNDPVWKRGARIRTEGGEGVFLGAVHRAQIEGIRIPESLFKEAKRLCEADSMTSAGKIAALIGKVASACQGAAVGTISLLGDRSDLDKVVRKTGTFSFDKKVSDGLERLADEDESLDWSGSMFVDGHTKHGQLEIIVETTLREGEPLGWSPEAVPLDQRRPKGDKEIHVVNGFLASTANLEIHWSQEDGTGGTLMTDTRGIFKLKISHGLTTLKYRSESGIEYCDQIFLDLDAVETPSGQWQRLVNLGCVNRSFSGTPVSQDVLDLAFDIFVSEYGLYSESKAGVLTILDAKAKEPLNAR